MWWRRSSSTLITCQRGEEHDHRTVDSRGNEVIFGRFFAEVIVGALLRIHATLNAAFEHRSIVRRRRTDSPGSQKSRDEELSRNQIVHLISTCRVSLNPGWSIQPCNLEIIEITKFSFFVENLDS